MIRGEGRAIQPWYAGSWVARRNCWNSSQATLYQLGNDASRSIKDAVSSGDTVNLPVRLQV